MEMLVQYLPKEMLSESERAVNLKDELPEETDHTDGIEAAQMDQLKKLDMLDVQTGLAYNMGEESFYIEILKEYMQEDKTKGLKDFYDSKDWKNYRILVHALKSTSLTIGAVRLSEDAKALEKAAKEENIDYIREHHESLMTEYRRLEESLKVILGEPSNKR